MAPRYFVRDTDNILLEYTEAAEKAAPTGFTAVDRSVILAAYAGNQRNIRIGGTWDGTTYRPPTGQVAKTDQGDNLNALHAAYQDWHFRIRKQGWASLSGLATPEQGLFATDRWVYQQVAIGDRIARGEWLASATQAFRDAAIAQIVLWVGTNSQIWYNAVSGTPGRTTVTSWAGASITGGSALYTDILVASGTTIGTPRTPATEFTLINPPLAIHANFNPELATLRSG